jgi:hypothetical protein
MPSRWPEPRLAIGFVARAVASWLFVRLLVGITPGLVLPTLIVLATTVGIAVVDARWRRLPIFLSNLGVAPLPVVACWLTPVLLLESPIVVGIVPETVGLLALMAA